MKRIAITTGDPAGVGPEIIRKCLLDFKARKDIAYIIYGDGFIPPGYSFIRSADELHGTAEDSGKIILIDSPEKITDRWHLYAIIIPSHNVTPGKPDMRSAESTYKILCRVVQDIKKFNLEGLVTSPVSKTAVRLFEPDFIGHTEFLAREFNTSTYVMNFVSKIIDVALLTTHKSLQDVTYEISKEKIIPKMRLVSEFARQRYKNSKVALLGLNPHCGEDGAFGCEEQVLRESLSELKSEGIDIDGPFPADSFFRYKRGEYRQVIACYHDQGLIPFKMISDKEGVNVTLGLPFFRASVDHGTAYDIAGKGIASPRSIYSALRLTEEIITG